MKNYMHGIKKIRNIASASIIVLVVVGCASKSSTRKLPLWQKKALQDVLYLANDQQVAEIIALTTEEEVAPYMEKLWSFQDPTPDTPENEIREEYERRLEHVYATYSHFRKLKNSDRSRTYLLYGAPDEILKTVKPNLFTPTSLQVPRMEIWLYPPMGEIPYTGIETVFDDMHLGFSKFVFIDFEGFGRYVQIYANVAGEIISPIAANLKPRRSLN